MQVVGVPPSVSIPKVEKPSKVILQGSPISAKKVTPLGSRNSKLYRLPSSAEHIARDSITAKQQQLANLPSSIEIRQIFARKYHLGRILGRGASAEVFEARLQSSDSSSFPFAVKVIHRDNRMNDTLTMATELEILRRIQHSNVVGLVEVYETMDTLYLVMERAQGGDLISALAAIPEYTESAVRDIFRQLLVAVEYLHSLGIVHRDLKLDNLLFDVDQSSSMSNSDDETDDESVSSHSQSSSSRVSAQNITVKVADFGLSAMLPSSEAPSKLQLLLSSPSKLEKKDGRLTDMWGTTEYFAPEVYDRHYGRQADVWALGCILFEMLTGELAFPYRETQISLVERVLFHGGKKPVRVFERKKGWSKLSPAAKSLIKQMLKTSPTKRLSIKECLEHPWFASSASSLRSHLKHVSSAESVQTCSTCSSDASMQGEILSEAQQVLKERVARRERRYQNLLLEVAMRNKDRK